MLRFLGLTAITLKVIVVVIIIWWGDSLLVRASVMSGAMVLMTGLEEWIHRAMISAVWRRRFPSHDSAIP